MDELTIDGKTYVSSKRAAKITGYAKDYVGQLCREGRVAARLVGRNWYILEDSIREHRFGNGSENSEAAAETAENEAVSGVEQTLARYQAEIPTPLPPVEERPKPAPAAVEEMQAAWKEWFQMKSVLPEAPESTQDPVEAATEILEEEPVPVIIEEELQEPVEDEVVEFEAVPVERTYEPEPEPVEVTISRPVQVNRAVIDLTAPTRHVYEEPVAVTTPRMPARKQISDRQSSRLPVQAFLLSVAGLSIVAALIGAGIAEGIVGNGDGGGIQASVIRFLEGKTVVEK